MVHHPPTRHHVKDRKALRDDVPFQRLLATHRVPLVLHGHIHKNTYVDAIDGVRIYSTASASSAMQDRPASYRVFDIDADGQTFDVQMTLNELRDGRVERAQRETWRHDAA